MVKYYLHSKYITEIHMQTNKKKNKKEKANKSKSSGKENSVDEKMLKIIDAVLQENLEQLLKNKKVVKNGNPIRIFKRKYC